MYFNVFDNETGTNRVVSDDEWDPDFEDPISDGFETRAEAEDDLDDLYQGYRDTGLYTRGDDEEYQSRHRPSGGSSYNSSSQTTSSSSSSYSSNSSYSGGGSSLLVYLVGGALLVSFLYCSSLIMGGMIRGFIARLLSPGGLLMLGLVVAWFAYRKFKS